MGAAVTDHVLEQIQPELAKSIGGDLEQTTRSLVTRFDAINVVDTASCQQAVIDRQAIGDAVKRVEEFFAPFKAMAHKLHRALCDRENEILTPVRLLDGKLRSAISDYKTAEDRERQRKERELAEQRQRDDQARAAAEAAALESAGEHALAAAVVEEAIAAPAPVVVLPDTTKQVEGLKFRTEWKWRYVNNDQARAMELIPRSYLCLDEKKVNAYVRAMKGSASIPGIQVYSEQVPVR